MHDSNVIGPMIAKLRCQRNWSQQLLAAKMQVKGFDITRDVIANIESRRSIATDEHIIGFLRVFGVRVKDLFPRDIQELDDQAEKDRRARQDRAN